MNMRFWIRGRSIPSATVVLAVFRRAGSNAVEVAKSIRAIFPSVRAELPPSIYIVPIYDRSETIVNSVNDVKETLIIAFVLVVLVIFLFLGRVRDTLIPAIALPLSLLITFVAMNVLGYSLDNLSLMALTLAIGFLVDDAIVFLENTVRLMEQGQKALEATLNSAKEISFTILGDDDFSRRRFHSAGFHERPRRPNFPRIFHHHHRLHLRQRHRLTHSHAAHVLALAHRSRRGRQENISWSASQIASNTASSIGTAVRFGFSCASDGFPRSFGPPVFSARFISSPLSPRHFCPSVIAASSSEFSSVLKVHRQL